MFSRLFAFFILIVVIYVSAVFLVPDIADTYGNASWNTRIREIKSKLDKDAPVFGSGGSIVENLTNMTKPYIEETKGVTKQIQTTVDTKTKELKQVTESAQNAIKAVESAKNDIQKLTNFGTGQ